MPDNHIRFHRDNLLQGAALEKLWPGMIVSEDLAGGQRYCEIAERPQRNSSGVWVWKARERKSGKLIDFAFDPQFPDTWPKISCAELGYVVIPHIEVGCLSCMTTMRLHTLALQEEDDREIVTCQQCEQVHIATCLSVGQISYVTLG